jgi:hypothetical protein
VEHELKTRNIHEDIKQGPWNEGTDIKLKIEKFNNINDIIRCNQDKDYRRVFY